MNASAAIAHAIVVGVIVAALLVLALFNKIPGSYAYSGIIAIALGAGVIAGVNTTTPTPPPTPPRSVTTTAQKG